ncbi:transcriptional protein SWT1 isoform X2 [Melanotaenia boesemani]|uniref:transcriptional protein SWT1 isoform X2 n=1 Tax=Melanotaenia boesemani TaxID=1250792 RepID=UPI001C03AE6B|nr:transcriptional protein SWT1 isoform X2 [Melanotaenia boesemani]
MSKHSKKRKRKRSPSSSSEEDKKLPKRKDDSHHCSSVKRKESVKSHKRCRKEPQKSVKEDSRSSRHIKKPVYRRPETPAAEKQAIHKEQCTKPRSVSVPSHGEQIFSKAKQHSSEKDKTIRGSESAESGPSKPLTTRVAASVAQTEETSKDRSDKNPSQGSPSKLKRQQNLSPSFGVTKQESQRQVVREKKCLPEKPQKDGNDSSIIKTLETVSSSSKDSSQQKNRESVKGISKSSPVTEPKFKKSLCTGTKNDSASITEKSSTSTKHTTSENSSKAMKYVISASKSDTPVPHETAQSSSTLQIYSQKFVPFKFKIPKKVRPIPSHTAGKTSENHDAVTTNTYLKKKNEHSHSGTLMKKVEQDVIQPASSCFSGTPKFQSVQQDKESLSGQHPSTGDTNTKPQYDQTQVVEQLYLARSEKKLELMQGYGELTCMDIDSPEERPTDSSSRQRDQQNLMLILDTNILLSHLDYVKKIISHGLGALGNPVVLIPWVVLQELDSLKRGRGLSGSVAHLATPAISYIYNALKNGEPRLWGQSMQQAAESNYGLNAENNDDRVLQCCLQYRNMHPECSLILCTNDKNLCSKALLSGVRALCKTDLEAEVERSRHGLYILQNVQSPILPHITPQVASPELKRSSTPAQSHSQERGSSVGVLEKDGKQLSKAVSVEAKWLNNRCLSELEECLREVLSDVLEVEMKAAYDDLWLEIVYIKPPWTLQDVLQCLKKHWIAVFGQIAPRRNLENVLNLINFFNSGQSVDCRAASAAVHEAKDLVKAFWKSSNHVAPAISVMESIFSKLQPEQHLSVEGESFACDVVMNDDDEEKWVTSAQVSHQEMWALFENVWSNLYQTSLEVFKALGFDPRTMHSAPTVGAHLPPQDTLACLHKLFSVVSQLLQAFSSVLSSAPGLQEVQALLSIMHSNKIINEDSRLTAKDLLDCFSQPDYREKLKVGGGQLMELKEALDCCVRANDQHLNQLAYLQTS